MRLSIELSQHLLQLAGKDEITPLVVLLFLLYLRLCQTSSRACHA
jgi:hypothetical protein